MDHSSHDHHHMMDHSPHAGHGDGGPMCNMNMLFTWDTTDLCVVFRQWRITSTLSLVVSLVAVVAICAGYEALREGIRRYEAALSRRIDTVPRQNREQITRRAHVTKAVLYGIQNFYAFMIMLIFMTYNGWVMIAVSVGAGLGYLVFGGQTPVTKETACH
jgi:copper transporter 1